jgi:ABC-type Fe3+ transport system permease subunit
MTIELQRAALEREIQSWLRRGYVVVSQTGTSAQLRRPKRFSIVWALLWTCVAGVGLLVYLFYHLLLKKDHWAYLTVRPDGKVDVQRRSA